MHSKHLILIGFKGVGKTVVGRGLANQLNKCFIDLDDEIEQSYSKQYQTSLTCRSIMLKHGELYFRQLESRLLENTLVNPPAIISLGGGTPMLETNQRLIGQHQLIHITATPDVVLDRILSLGKPAFFSDKHDIDVTFKQLWAEREPIYASMTNIKIQNIGTVESAIDQIVIYLTEAI